MKIHRVVQMLGATTSTGKLADDMYDLNYKDYYSETEDRVIPISHMDFQHLVRAFVKQNEETDMENQRLVQQLEHDETVVSKEAYQVMWDNCQELQKKYADLKKQTDVLVKDNSELRFQIQQVDRNQTVSKEAYDIAWDNNKILKKQVAHWKKLAEDNFISSINDSETSDTFKNKYEELRKTYAVLLEDYNTDTGRGVWKDRYEHELKMAEYWKDAFYKKDVIKGCGYTFSEIPNDTDGQEFVDTMKKYFNKKSYKMRVRGQHIKPELRGTGATAYGQNIEESTHMRVYIDIK